MSVQRFVIIALLTGCTAGADRSDVGGSGDTALAESGFERECVDRIDIHPVCDCALTLSWSLNDTVERVGLVALSSSAVDARSTYCTEGLGGRPGHKRGHHRRAGRSDDRVFGELRPDRGPHDRGSFLLRHDGPALVLLVTRLNAPAM